MANKANQTKQVNETAVQIITCAIKSIQVYGTVDSDVRYRATLDTEIDAIKRDENGDYIQAKVNYIDFVPRVLIAQCINLIPGLDIMYTKKKESGLRNDNGNGFGAAELQVVLRGAKLKIERTKFEAGSEYTTTAGETETHENAGYKTNIDEITVTDKVQAKLDDIFDSVFDI